MIPDDALLRTAFAYVPNVSAIFVSEDEEGPIVRIFVHQYVGSTLREVEDAERKCFAVTGQHLNVFVRQGVPPTGTAADLFGRRITIEGA